MHNESEVLGFPKDLFHSLCKGLCCSLEYTLEVNLYVKYAFFFPVGIVMCPFSTILKMSQGNFVTEQCRDFHVTYILIFTVIPN